MTETKPLEEKALTVIEQAKTLPDIWTAQDFDKAGHFALLIKDQIRDIEGYFKPQKVNLDNAKRVILDEEKRLLGPLKDMLTILDPKIAAFLREQKRLKDEAEEKARQEALRKSEEEKLARALKAEQDGHKEVAQEILAEPDVRVAVERVAPVPKVSGISITENWKARVVSLPALIQAVAKGEAPANCLMADTIFLGKEARATKGACLWPGCEFYSEDSVRKG